MTLDDAREFGVDVSEDGKWITLGGDYDIEVSRISSERDVLAWVLHLTEKSWVTTSMIHAFIEVLRQAKGFKLHGL